MPKNKSSNIRKYFLYNASIDKSICQCDVTYTDVEEPSINSESEDDLSPTNSRDGLPSCPAIRTRSSTSSSHSHKVKQSAGGDTKLQKSEERLKTPRLFPVRNRSGKVKFVPKSVHTSILDSHTTRTSKKCGAEISGSKASNLETHIRTHHPSIHQKYLDDENKISKTDKVGGKRKADEKQCATVSKSLYQPKLMKYFPESTIISCKVMVNPQNVLDGIIEMLTVNGRSFNLIETSGFIRAFGSVLEACGIVLNVHNVKDRIRQKRQEMEDRIKLYQNRLISLKVDCVTRLEQSFIGVNMQLIDKGKIKVFNLATKKILVRHTGENLKKIILMAIAKFNFEVQNLYSVTTDNGSNLLKAIDLMATFEDDKSNSSEPEIWDENDTNIHDNEEMIETLLTVKWDSSSIGCFSVRCAAHTMQLCILDSLKEISNIESCRTYNDVIGKAREVVKSLRQQHHANHIQEEKLCKPILDCQTRWSSTHRMLSSLLNLRKYCEKWGLVNADVYLTDEEWDCIMEIKMCLEPAKKAMTKLQSESITMTDCHKTWEICHIETAELGSAFSQIMVDNFNKRREAIFGNDIFLAAMYLDPRFQFELDEEQREKAILHILQIRKKLKILKLKESDGGDKDMEAQLQQILSDTESTASTSMDEDEISYERLIRQKHTEKIRQQRVTVVPESEFKSQCRAFNPPRLKTSASIVQFWQENKSVYPELFPVAEVIFAVPCTQVSVERLFSQLRFILDPLRNRLTSDVLDDILFIKSNFYNFLQ